MLTQQDVITLTTALEGWGAVHADVRNFFDWGYQTFLLWEAVSEGFPDMVYVANSDDHFVVRINAAPGKGGHNHLRFRRIEEAVAFLKLTWSHSEDQ